MFILSFFKLQVLTEATEKPRSQPSALYYRNAKAKS